MWWFSDPTTKLGDGTSPKWWDASMASLNWVKITHKGGYSLKTTDRFKLMRVNMTMAL